MSAEAPSRPSKGLRVLLVEDEMMVAFLLETMLAELGHQAVGPVAHLDKALEMARREAVDVAILDVNINGKEVYPVAAALDARGIPFIFATGYGRAGLRASYRGRPTLQKPYLLDDLREAIAELCRVRGTR
jgi:CheY-like chemotaxis protein